MKEMSSKKIYKSLCHNEVFQFTQVKNYSILYISQFSYLYKSICSLFWRYIYIHIYYIGYYIYLVE